MSKSRMEIAGKQDPMENVAQPDKIGIMIVDILSLAE